MTTKDHRKAIPLGVKLHACLLLLGYTERRAQRVLKLARRFANITPRLTSAMKALGFSDEDIAAGIEWDHQPALAFREIVDGVMTPAPNDPRYIRPMRAAEHRKKTSGTRATSAGSDVHMAAKVKRITGETPKRTKQKIPGRGFPKRKDRK